MAITTTRPQPTESSQTQQAADPRRNGNMNGLPVRPQTASDVPWLTSLHATNGRGPYGDARYRGNCSGLLIRDLLNYYKPKRVIDPMCGGGTCLDVCADLHIDCTALDLREGFDATNPSHYRDLGEFDFVWLHPPYWKMIHYNDDQRCLSNAPTVNDFLRQLRAVIHNSVVGSPWKVL